MGDNPALWERVRLRPVEPGDLPRMYALQLDPDSNRMAVTNPRTREAFDIHWAAALGWTPPTDAVRWARQMYECWEFTDLPILADLLEDAGCPNRPLLDHCRCCQEHVRGCAVLDRILGL